MYFYMQIFIFHTVWGLDVIMKCIILTFGFTSTDSYISEFIINLVQSCPRLRTYDRPVGIRKLVIDHFFLVLSGPAGPNWHKSVLNRVLYPTVSGRFAKRPFYVRSLYRCSQIGIAQNLSGLSEMGSFQIIDIKLFSYKDSDVGNLRTFKYMRDYSGIFHNTWNTIILAMF